ncbi:hypothetical protein [Buttiauxella gaviniae]|uniref:hypothetical protein n=1 Tax=Buttiauxella gaviniae TaxID=82990 RepID=UPI003974B3A8
MMTLIQRTWVNAVALIMLLGVVYIAPALAVERTITAEFRPHAGNPNNNSFTNTTPCSLPGQANAWCNRPNGSFPVSMALSGITKDFRHGAAEDGVLVRTPAARTIQVTNDESGDTAELILEFTDLGYQVRGLPSLYTVTQGSLDTPDNLGVNCTKGRLAGALSTGVSLFLWPIVAAKQATGAECVKALKPEVVSNPQSFNSVLIGYKLTSPNPLEMRNGIYRGSQSYTLSPSGDFSFGSGNYSEVLTFNFELNVQHDFSIRQPPGSENVVLTPPGGWEQWLHRGTAPPSLQRDSQFFITSSSPLTLSMHCEHLEGLTCGLQSKLDDSIVPVQVAITVPGMKNAQGQAVEKLALTSRRPGERLGVESYIVDQRSTVHFQVDGPEVEQMIRQPGSRWRGGVTLIFDAGL